MRRLAALSAATVLLAGCGIDTSSDRTYNDALIRQVGNGSNALSAALHGIALGAASPFDTPSLERSGTFLLKGELNKLTYKDLTELAKANRRNAQRFDPTLAKLARFRSTILAARLSASSFQNLSPGAKRFLALWDEYLTQSATGWGTTRDTMEQIAPRINEFQTVLRTAYQARTPTAAKRFDKIRLHYISQVVQADRKFKAIRLSIEQASGYRG
jgi:hypothetical protein